MGGGPAVDVATSMHAARSIPTKINEACGCRPVSVLRKGRLLSALWVMRRAACTPADEACSGPFRRLNPTLLRLPVRARMGGHCATGGSRFPSCVLHCDMVRLAVRARLKDDGKEMEGVRERAFSSRSVALSLGRRALGLGEDAAASALVALCTQRIQRCRGSTLSPRKHIRDCRCIITMFSMPW